MRHVIITSTEALKFSSEVLLLLNERGFAVDNTTEAFKCIDALIMEILMRDVCTAEEEFSKIPSS